LVIQKEKYIIMRILETIAQLIIAIGYCLEGRCSIPDWNKRFVSSLERPHLPLVLQNLLQWEIGKLMAHSDRCMELTTFLDLVPRPRLVELYLHPTIFMA
jgi:hypothetical protein